MHPGNGYVHVKKYLYIAQILFDLNRIMLNATEVRIKTYFKAYVLKTQDLYFFVNKKDLKILFKIPRK